MKLWNTQEDVGLYSNEEYTPIELYLPIGPFDGDPCAGVGTNIGTEFNWTKADNGLWIPWPKKKTLFVNPPFGDETNEVSAHEWKCAVVDKCFEHGNNILLFPIGAFAQWQLQAYAKADAWFCVGKRIRFGGNKKDAKFSTYLFAFGQSMVQRLRNSGLKGCLMGRI